MLYFDFSTLYTKIPYDKLLYVFNEIIDFAFKGGARDYVTVFNSGAFWSWFKSKTGRSYSLHKIKSQWQKVNQGIPRFTILAGLIILREWCPCLTNQSHFSY